MNERSRRGVTLWELIIVISITVVLSGMLLVYGQSNKSQIALSIEVARLSQMFLRAKSLALATYTADVAPCGYGIHMDYPARRYMLVRYVTVDCTSIVTIDTAFEQTVETFSLDANVLFQGGANRIDDVIFLPPDPRTLVGAGGVVLSSGNGNVYLASRSGSFTATVMVSTAGQVNF